MHLRSRIEHGQIAPEAQVVRFSAREALSRLFEVEVELLLDDPDLDLEALLDTPCLLLLEDIEDGRDPIRFHGMIDEAEALDSGDLASRYRLRLQPRIATLALRVRSRLFQDRDSVEIVKSVLKDAGLPDDALSWRLGREYPKRELCVQYRESELQLVQRLLEHEGIFFWFQHSETGHVMAFGDGPGAHDPIDGERALAYTQWLQDDRESVTELVFSSALGPDSHLARDWNWERPSLPLEAERRRSGAKGRIWYEYPGGFRENAQGARHAQDRLDASDATRVLAGRSNCRRLAPGRLVEVEGAQPDYLDRGWLLVGVEHLFEGAPGQVERGQRYGARFRAIPADAAFRPERATRRPRVRGKELAVVTGPPGEEIHVDAMGRVKVHFYWDREGAHDDGSSTWIRAQQLNTSGAMTLPRVGWEVDVGFLDGDPDRPVVLQKLPNREAMPPHGLPDGKTKMALQSATSPAGPGVNALSMEDGSGGMELALVASRDLHVVAGHDQLVQVGRDEREEVGKSLQALVGGDEVVAVGQEQSISVGGGCALETVGDKTVAIGATDGVKVKGSHTVTCDGSRSESVGALANVLANKVVETVNGSSTRHIGAALSLNAVKALVEVVGGAKTETTGAARIEILRGAHGETIAGSKTLTAALVREKAGGDVSYAAKGHASILVGGPMAVKASSFVLSGPVVAIQAGSAVIDGGGSKLTAGGSLKVNASSMSASGKAVLMLKGKIDYSD